MGNKYADEHLNVDSLSGLGKVYSTDTGNVNPKISTVGVSIDNKTTLSLKLGTGGTFPVLDESVPKTQGGRDYLSMVVYSCDDVHDSDTELSPVDKYVYLVDKYMKQRQSFMIDVNSYNSQGIVMMSGAETTRTRSAGFEANETGVKKIGYAPADFSALSIGLSTFQVAKISREKTIVSFSRNGYLSLVFDPEGLTQGFRGSIEYEVTDNNKTIEDTLYRKNIIVTGEEVGLKFHNLPEQDFIESVETSSFEHTVEVLTSESFSPVDIDGKLLLYGARFIVNKTRKCIRVIFETGEAYSLNPFAVSLAPESKIGTVVIFKESFVKPSSIQYIGEQTTLYPMNEMYITAIDGKFMERAGRVIIDIGASSVTVVEGAPSGIVYFGQYKTSLPLREGDLSFHQFGDNNDSIRAIKTLDKYLYFHGGSVFVKDESDLNFTEVILPVGTGGGMRSAEICGVTFSSHYDTLLGGVTKNSSFMYEMNYVISENSIESEIIGDVYPVDFYRIEYLRESCISWSLPEFPMDTGHTTSKNRYEAGEISSVLSREIGSMGVSNAKHSNENMITYSYLSAFGIWSDTPFVVESFGHISRQTMRQSQEDHFLSLRLNSIEEARSNRTYCGNIKKIESDYIVQWTKVRNVDQSESFLFCENEYADEIQQHLGSSSFLGEGPACDKPPSAVNKLSYISDPFEYTIGMVDMRDSLRVNEPTMAGFKINKVIDAYREGHIASPDIKSQGTINGFGLNVLSVQNKTAAALTVVDINPSTIDLSDYLWTDSFVVTVPEIGFVHHVTHDRYSNMGIVSKVQIKNQFERGVKYQFNGFSITGKIKWDPGQGVNIAEYQLIDELNGQYNYSYSLFFPDSVDQNYASPWEPVEEYDPYDIIAIYTRRRKVDKLRMIPMYLANFLYVEFGFVQNILGIWDESSGVLIDDLSTTMSKSDVESGFKITVTCSGAEPMFFMDHYVTMSAYEFGTPYRISRETRLSIIRTNLLSKFSKEEMIEAEHLSSMGDKIGASRLVMNGYIKNFVDSINDDDVRIEFSPDVFYPQGPWQNPHLYAKHEDLIMQGKSYSIELMPYSRIITSLCVTSGNTVRFSHPAKRFSEMYSIVDGFVTKETLNDIKEDERQRGENTYSMEYIHHVGGGVNLKRDIYGDLLLYPARHSYPINNLIRELLSPTREDAHSKTMDARAVFSRFDTRYVSNTIPSYYDKFLEFPTAFTCDALPEEAVLLRGFSSIESLYLEDITYIKGDDIIGDKGIAKVSFSNNTDQVVSIAIQYDNERWGDGLSSFDISDAYSLQRDGWLVYEPHINKRVGREKSGVFLEGTTI